MRRFPVKMTAGLVRQPFPLSWPNTPTVCRGAGTSRIGATEADGSSFLGYSRSSQQFQPS